MAVNKRLLKELATLKSSDCKSFKIVEASENKILSWKLLLLPDVAPYNKGAFKVDITFPPEYPFKSPTISFQTPIYHPNVDSNGHKDGYQ